MPPRKRRVPHPCDADGEAQEPRTGDERPGLPDEATVVSEKIFTSPKGRRYRILRTTQTDPYDDSARKSDERP